MQDIANDGLEKAAGEGKLKVYCGFDPTASSLHIGNLLGIIALKWFQMCGHHTVGLLGGATVRVGDPSGGPPPSPFLCTKAGLGMPRPTTDTCLAMIPPRSPPTSPTVMQTACIPGPCHRTPPYGNFSWAS